MWSLCRTLTLIHKTTKYPPLVSTCASFYQSFLHASYNTHVQYIHTLTRTSSEVVMHRYHAGIHLPLLDISLCLSCFSQRQNTTLYQPIRAGFVLLLKSLFKGQSLRVALGKVCGMGKAMVSHYSCLDTGLV